MVATSTETEVPTSGTGEVGGSTEVVMPAGESAGDSSTSVDGETFIIPSDGGTICGCDVFGQDCPSGEKCAAYANDGGSSWNDAKCVPVMEDPGQPGAPCFVEGSGVSGIDSCDVGVMCWDTDAENKGTCVALCKGSPEDPMCPPWSVCAISGGAVLNLCLPNCLPLEEDPCPQDGDACIPSGQGFLCVLDASGEEGQVNDRCMFANACDPGLYCIGVANAVECDQAADGCCQPFCDVTQANMCAGAGQECIAWYEEGTAPPEYENVGICAVPMP